MTGCDPAMAELVGDLDQAFGRRMRGRREDLGMSQQQLADALHDYGFSWHQTTVGKTESGERPIKLAEAVAVALALGYGTQLDELVNAEPDNVRRRDRIGVAYLELLMVRKQVGSLGGSIDERLAALREQLEEAAAENPTGRPQAAGVVVRDEAEQG